MSANCRANRMKEAVRDGVGIWLLARRLYQGKFLWPSSWHGWFLDEVGCRTIATSRTALP
ncbi:IS66 family insertion sequence element accessory protein TnpB [Pseudomonas sp. JL3]|uniref:IS66 family insertion sequence element accessory protein TnpB n=1 Tax=Pseudomonas sp. JL3 TaxID=2919943 RepID=UPI0038621564